MAPSEQAGQTPQLPADGGTARRGATGRVRSEGSSAEAPREAGLWTQTRVRGRRARGPAFESQGLARSGPGALAAGKDGAMQGPGVLLRAPLAPQEQRSRATPSFTRSRGRVRRRNHRAARVPDGQRRKSDCPHVGCVGWDEAGSRDQVQRDWGGLREEHSTARCGPRQGRLEGRVAEAASGLPCGWNGLRSGTVARARPPPAQQSPSRTLGRPSPAAGACLPRSPLCIVCSRASPPPGRGRRLQPGAGTVKPPNPLSSHGVPPGLLPVPRRRPVGTRPRRGCPE